MVAGLLTMAATFTVLLVVRSTPWLTWLNLLAALLLMTVAFAVRPDDEGFGPASGRVSRMIPVVGLAARAPALLVAAAANEASVVSVDRGAVRAWMRAAAITTPAVAALVVLLASADALFASFLTVPIDPIGLGRHGFTIVVGSAGALGAMAIMTSDLADEPARDRHLGSGEAGSILAGFIIVETAFVASQAAAIIGGRDYVQSATGLTYSEYARSGFFQLLAAAALALAVIWTVDQLTREAASSARRWVIRLGLTVTLLTIAIVAISIRRLALYEQEFGLTMLRLFTTVFAAWLAIVFVVAAVHLVRQRGSLLVSIATSVIIGLLAMNAANPEAVVARRNLERFSETGQLDVAYLVNELGPDAADVLYEHPSTRVVLCKGPPPEGDPWLSFNLGRQRATEAHARSCP